MYKAVLTLLLGLTLLASGSAHALSLKCERTTTSHDAFSTQRAFESWFPKTIRPTAEDQVSASKGNQVRFQINGAIYDLTPSKWMLAKLPEKGNYKSVTGVRYKCNASPARVKSAFRNNNESSGGSTQSATAGNVNRYPHLSDSGLCNFATRQGRWEKQSNYLPYVKEAKRRGLNCGVDESGSIQTTAAKPYKKPWFNEKFKGVNNANLCANRWSGYLKEAQLRGLTCGVSETNSSRIASGDASNTNPRNQLSGLTDKTVCGGATTEIGGKTIWKKSSNGVFPARPFIDEAKRRGLTCGVGENTSTQVVSTTSSRVAEIAKAMARFSNSDICRMATYEGAWNTREAYQEVVYEAKRRGLTCGVGESGSVQTAAAPKPSVSSAELTAAQQEAQRLREELAALKAQQKQQQATISADKQVPLITIISSSSNGPQGSISGRVTDNTGVGEVRVDGRLVSLDGNGNFAANTYVPEGGISIIVEAFDLAGLSSSMSVRLNRDVVQTAAFSFDRLNPLRGKAAANPNALALIIGVSDYKETSAPAVYADTDAKVFADYAAEKLGVPRQRIKTLVNDGADEKDVLLAAKRWLARGSLAGQSDVYVFFAGHGLASDDGEKMYLLPYDGAPELLDKTAILRDELFTDIAAANPRSVTVFLDTCYSGTTRGPEMLVASRPITIRAKESAIPEGFTVMTAAAGDQTAKPLEEAKHGMFSYFLMKGMEGDADANSDNEITAGELHAYVQQNVIQQSSGSQTPELQGDADRVLVRFQ